MATLCAARGAVRWLCLCNLIFVLLLKSSCGQVIHKEPENRTVDLNMNATFTCVTNGGSDFTFWRINGTATISPEIEKDIYRSREREGENNAFRLTILARAVYNGTIIRCVAEKIGVDVRESANVTLKIREPYSVVNIAYQEPEYRVLFSIPGDVKGVVGYFLHEEKYLRIPVLEDGSVTLPAKKNYSTTLEISNATKTWNISGPSFTTFDVQSVTAKGDNVTVNFINNTRALGFFVVLHCKGSSHDVFRFFLRVGSDNVTVNITSLDGAHSCAYTLYVYDLEEDGSIYNKPAIILQDRKVTLANDPSSTNHQSKNLADKSIYLRSAELSVGVSKVTIRCEFTDDYPEASCVLVYKEYDKPTLKVNKYDRSTVFPVSISVANPEKYAFAVFGQNIIEEDPVIVMRGQGRETYEECCDPSSEGRLTPSIFTFIVAALVAVLITTLREEECNLVKNVGKATTQHHCSADNEDEKPKGRGAIQREMKEDGTIQLHGM